MISNIHLNVILFNQVIDFLLRVLTFLGIECFEILYGIKQAALRPKYDKENAEGLISYQLALLAHSNYSDSMKNPKNV